MLEWGSRSQPGFNPRSRAGSDRKQLLDGGELLRFQSTLPRGERPPTSRRKRGMFGFQSTLPRGERPDTIEASFQNLSSFNPRSRAGSDDLTKIHLVFTGWFQSTLPRGERQKIHPTKRTCVKFQSTLPRGERRCTASSPASRLMFQSTLPRGERRVVPSDQPNMSRFQSTLPRGERPLHAARRHLEK